MFNLVGAVITGLVVGWLARFFYPGTVPMGWIMTSLLGIGGSMLASAFGVWAAGADYRDGVNRAGCLASVLGAMALIFIGRHLF
ncbi:MAG: GlsB/YeaQ/YmgE family stress response membrane protein [Sphingomonadales bacterium]|nr:GlsB/YeaQ/YmgE family stress response membrane protein [Sphingomonadales bacterium]